MRPRRAGVALSPLRLRRRQPRNSLRALRAALAHAAAARQRPTLRRGRAVYDPRACCLDGRRSVGSHYTKMVKPHALALGVIRPFQGKHDADEADASVAVSRSTRVASVMMHRRHPLHVSHPR